MSRSGYSDECAGWTMTSEEMRKALAVAFDAGAHWGGGCDQYWDHWTVARDKQRQAFLDAPAVKTLLHASEPTRRISRKFRFLFLECAECLRNTAECGAKVVFVYLALAARCDDAAGELAGLEGPPLSSGAGTPSALHPLDHKELSDHLRHFIIGSSETTEQEKEMLGALDVLAGAGTPIDWNRDAKVSRALDYALAIIRAYKESTGAPIEHVKVSGALDALCEAVARAGAGRREDVSCLLPHVEPDAISVEKSMFSALIAAVDEVEQLNPTPVVRAMIVRLRAFVAADEAKRTEMAAEVEAFNREAHREAKAQHEEYEAKLREGDTLILQQDEKLAKYERELATLREDAVDAARWRYVRDEGTRGVQVLYSAMGPKETGNIIGTFALILPASPPFATQPENAIDAAMKFTSEQARLNDT